MGLESGTYISDLVVSNPASGDLKSQGDDHIRLLKSTIKTTFPNVSGAVTPTHTELNYVDGVTSAIQTQIDGKVDLAAGATAGNIATLDASGQPTDSGANLASKQDALSTVPDAATAQDDTSTTGYLWTPERVNDALKAPGMVAQVQTMQTRTIGSYSVTNVVGSETAITPMAITFTPKQAGNKAVIEFAVNWTVSIEWINIVWLVARNGTILTDAQDATPNVWSGITGIGGIQFANVMGQSVVRIVDDSTLGVSSTYQLLARHTLSAGPHTLYLNRTVSSAGAAWEETGLSSCVATEVWQ